MAVTEFKNQLCYRLIPSKYPPINLYEDVADADQLEAIFAIESITNPRLEEEVGNFSVIPVEERLVGIPHCSYVMAAFTHINPDGSRFSTADFGAYYAARERITAIKETIYHTERIFSYTKEPAQDIHMRSLEAHFSGQLTDITNDTDSPLYHPDDYNASQAFAAQLKTEKSDGIVYASVRNNHAQCYALFKPCLINKITPSAHFNYHWNGTQISRVYEIKLLDIS